MKRLGLTAGPVLALLTGCCLVGCQPSSNTDRAQNAPRETADESSSSVPKLNVPESASPAGTRWRRHVDATTSVAEDEPASANPETASAQHIAELQETLTATQPALLQKYDPAALTEIEGRTEETGLMPVPGNDPGPAAPGPVAEQHAALDVANPAAVAQTHEQVLTAAEQGDAEAQLQLALRYHQGNGVAQDEEQANYWLQKAEENFAQTQQSGPNVIIARSQKPKFAPRKVLGLVGATHTVYAPSFSGSSPDANAPAADFPTETPVEFVQAPPLSPAVPNFPHPDPIIQPPDLPGMPHYAPPSRPGRSSSGGLISADFSNDRDYRVVASDIGTEIRRFPLTIHPNE